MQVPDLEVGKQLFVGEGGTKALGGLRGSYYIEGPLQIGKDDDFGEDTFQGVGNVDATLMVGHENNSDHDNHPTTSLAVKGDVHIDGDEKISNKYSLFVKGNAFFDFGDIGDLQERFDVADSKPVKPFDMVHPSKGKGQSLRYACIEGPEAGVYYRGRLKNGNVIELPTYWKDLVHSDSISVQLQPIGAHQDIIVKRWDEEKIFLQAKGGMPIDCFYHVYAERKDVNKLIVEYEGSSFKDYPDPDYNDPKYGGQNIITG